MAWVCVHIYFCASTWMWCVCVWCVRALTFGPVQRSKMSCVRAVGSRVCVLGMRAHSPVCAGPRCRPDTPLRRSVTRGRSSGSPSRSRTASPANTRHLTSITWQYKTTYNTSRVNFTPFLQHKYKFKFHVWDQIHTPPHNKLRI